MTRINSDVHIGTTASGSEWIAYRDRHSWRDVEIMVERIGRFGGTPTDEALCFLGRQPAVLTVKLTPAQADRLELLLPESLLGMELLATRVKGTRDELRAALHYLDADTAWDLAQAGVWSERPEQSEFAERAVRRSVAILREKIVAAAR